MSSAILLLLVLVFLLEYYLNISFINKMFKHSKEEIYNEVLLEENSHFKVYIITKLFFSFLQFIAAVISINIGLLFFKYKIKIKKILQIVFNSFIAILIVKVLCYCFFLFNSITFNRGAIDDFEEKLVLTNYLNLDSSISYLELPLQVINLTHILFILLLAYSLRKLINKGYFKSLIFTLKTYGLAVGIWFMFSTIMELNFN